MQAVQISLPYPSQPGREAEEANTASHISTFFKKIPEAWNIYSITRHTVVYSTALFTSSSPEKYTSAGVLQHRNMELAEDLVLLCAQQNTQCLFTYSLSFCAPQSCVRITSVVGYRHTYNMTLPKSKNQHPLRSQFYSRGYLQ